MTTEFVRQDLAQNSSTTAEPDRVRVIREGVASYLPDIDPEETAEWLESFDELLERSGPARARYLMLRLLERSGEQRVLPAMSSCPSPRRSNPARSAVCAVITIAARMARSVAGRRFPVIAWWRSRAVGR